MTDQARMTWKKITDTMLEAKKGGLSPRDLAEYTDKAAPKIIAEAFAAVRADERERCVEVLQILEGCMEYGLPERERVARIIGSIEDRTNMNPPA